MTLTNTKTSYGWIAIALHWISAIGVITLYFLGEGMEEATDRASKVAARDLHVSVGVLLFTFLAARLLWSLSQPKPEPFERVRAFHLAAKAVQILFLLMIAVLIVSGPLSVWADGRPLAAFDLFSVPSPFGPSHDLAEALEEIHEIASKLFWPLIVLHVGGALKHLVIDRDATLQRMLWVKRA